MTIALFFNGQCRLANSKNFCSQTSKCKIQFDSDVKAMKIKLNGRGGFCRSREFTLFFIGHMLAINLGI